jgi:phosphatidylglycerophosphate synthase
MPVNSGAFLEHVTITNVQLRARVAVASVFLVIGVGILATLARAALPVGELYAVKSLAVLALVTIVATSLVDAHHPFARFGAANQMTMVRAALVALVAGLIGEPAVVPVAAAATGIAAVAAMLDGADGWLARRGDIASEFGARFDMEIDALLIMVLAILAWQHGKAGSWALLSGLLRYGFVAAGWLAPWLARPLPPSRRRQTVCIVQIAGLCVAVSPIVTPPASAIVAAATLMALVGSFLVDIVWLARVSGPEALGLGSQSVRGPWSVRGPGS